MAVVSQPYKNYLNVIAFVINAVFIKIVEIYLSG